MNKFTTFTAIVAPLNRVNVDTDAIIPKQFLKSIKRSGFGPNLFDEWRYLDQGEPGQDNSKRLLNPKFVLNEARYHDAEILLTQENFGCGSSREHAPWALLDYGFRVIIAPSYADIFYNNCFKNGILPITLDARIFDFDALFEQVDNTINFVLTINLEAQTIINTTDGSIIKFEIEEYRKKRLLEGLDDIGLTLKLSSEIRDYEKKQQLITPWLFNQK